MDDRVGDRMERTEVCVVGAGPAGLALALVLKQAGIPCIVLERLSPEAFQRRADAGLIEHRTVQQLVAHGLAEPILAHGDTSGEVEFRFEGQSSTLAYAALTGGRGNYTYPQHELVAAHAARLRTEGGDLRFGIHVSGLTQTDEMVEVEAIDADTGAPLRVQCRFVAACDGARSTLRTAIPGARVIGHHHPFRWLAVVADTRPPTPRAVYGLHPRGFASQLRRGPQLTRYVLEIPPDDTLGDWPDPRIWGELGDRLRAVGEPGLPRGSFVARHVLDLRVRVVAPMHHGRVFLVGDAAHLLTPAAGKGMNLAIQDALELGEALIERYGPRPDDTRLAAYSANRLPAVWRAQEFSNWTVTLLHTGAGRSRAGGPAPEETEPDDFAYHLRLARLQELIDNPRLSRWFAHAYAGVDP